MKKIFRLKNLGCAHCAAKMEDKISKLDGVNSCNISFMTQKLTIDALDDKFDSILEEAKLIIKKIERNCEVI